VFNWEFEVSQYKGGKKIPVEVFLVMDQERPFFRAKSPELAAPIDHSDINALRLAVEQAMAEQVVPKLISIEWEDWLKVTVKGHNRLLEGGQWSSAQSYAQLEIRVQTIKRGIHPATGEVVTIASDGRITEFPKPRNIETNEKDGVLLGDIPETSFIPATPENLRALDDIRDRLGMLRSRLAELLSQDSIQKSLADFNLLPGLPKPEPVERPRAFVDKTSRIEYNKRILIKERRDGRQDRH
jgi:hypothetical protein